MTIHDSVIQHRRKSYEDGFTALERLVALSIILAISALGLFLLWGYVEPVDPIPKDPFIILSSILVGIWLLYGIGVAVKKMYCKITAKKSNVDQ